MEVNRNVAVDENVRVVGFSARSSAKQALLGAGAILAGSYSMKQMVWPHLLRWCEGRRSQPTAAQQMLQSVVQDMHSQHEDVTRLMQQQTAGLMQVLGEVRGAVDGLAAQQAQLEAAAKGLQQQVGELRQAVTHHADATAEAAAAAAAAAANAGAARSGWPGRVELAALKAELRDMKQLLQSSPPKLLPAKRSSPAAAGWQRAPVEQPPPPAASPLGAGTVDAPPHPPSYQKILEMLEQGIQPPGIRTDIVDTPPLPDHPPSASKLQPRPKPWRSGCAAGEEAGMLPPPWEQPPPEAECTAALRNGSGGDAIAVAAPAANGSIAAAAAAAIAEVQVDGNSAGWGCSPEAGCGSDKEFDIRRPGDGAEPLHPEVADALATLARVDARSECRRPQAALDEQLSLGWYGRLAAQ